MTKRTENAKTQKRRQRRVVAEQSQLEVRTCHPNSLHPDSVNELGRAVRDAWIEWAKQQPSPKPSWLVPWNELSEADKDADRRIGLTLWCIFTRQEQGTVAEFRRAVWESARNVAKLQARVAELEAELEATKRLLT